MERRVVDRPPEWTVEGPTKRLAEQAAFCQQPVTASTGRVLPSIHALPNFPVK